MARTYSQIKVGAMIYSSLKKKAVQCHKEISPCRILSIKRSCSYEELVERAKAEFFENEEGIFYLANSGRPPDTEQDRWGIMDTRRPPAEKWHISEQS